MEIKYDDKCFTNAMFDNYDVKQFYIDANYKVLYVNRNRENRINSLFISNNVNTDYNKTIKVVVNNQEFLMEPSTGFQFYKLNDKMVIKIISFPL